jgi:hypothetical protein
MRNKSSNVQVTKKRLSKCEEVFRSYSDIQLQYANLLESDDSILEFKCNVVLDDFELDGTYTTDFLITKTSGEILIRECIMRDKISKPMNIKLLDASHRYWTNRGIIDWGIVTNEET